jgi:hypothetical protein
VARRWIALLSILAVAGCTRVNAGWSLPSQADLASRRSFSLEAVSSSPGELSTASPEDWARRQRLLRTLILTELTNKGYRHSESSADFVVRYVAGVERKDGASTWGDGSLQGEIDVHAVDPVSGRWLWHGWATETLTARLDRDAEIRKAVREILSRFPPAS